MGSHVITMAAFSDLLSLIYAAAASPALWDEAILGIHAAFGSVTAQGRLHSTSLVFADGISRSMTGTLSAEAERAYSDYYGPTDFVLQAVERGPVGLTRTGAELIGPRIHTEFYNDWVTPNDLGDGIFVRLTGEAKPTSFLVAGSSGREPLPNQECVDLLTLLVPHLRRALRMQNDLSRTGVHIGRLRDALNTVTYGIAVVAGDLRVVEVNAEAERLLKRGDGLVLRAHRIVASRPVDRDEVDALLRRALFGDADGVRSGGSVACQRPSARRPLAVHILPLSRPAHESATHIPSAMVAIVDAESHRLPADVLLRRLFALTKAEAAVARLLLTGEGLGPIGEQLMLSRDTVKTHLRSIFLKTGTHRQAELVRLLLAVAP